MNTVFILLIAVLSAGQQKTKKRDTIEVIKRFPHINPLKLLKPVTSQSNNRKTCEKQFQFQLKFPVEPADPSRDPTQQQIGLIRRKWSYKKRRNLFVAETKSAPLPVRSSKKVQYELDFELKNEKPKSKFLTWLHNQTACQVNYQWVDLGIRYHPRYLARGACDRSRSCSIPAGMFCVPATERKIIFYRWWGQKWRKMELYVLTGCACSCSCNHC